MASLLKEEENYVRLALLLKGVSPRAVRTYFNSEFPPTYLPSTLNKNYNTLKDLQLKRVLNQAQWNLLFPTNGVPDSTTFDVTLMICLIRNLTSITQPIHGFDRLPLPVETTPGPDLARIKWYVVYELFLSLSDAQAISRVCGQSMNQECEELKLKILDQSNREIMLEIKQIQKEMEEIIPVLQDPIPWNIRGQIEEKLETWTEDEKMFIETNGSKSVLNCIKENGCVVITGSPGTGKSSVMRHVALQLQEEGYEIIPVETPENIMKWFNPGKKILFVVDDFCGTYTINPFKFENWKNLMGAIKTLVKKKLVKIIISCRLQVYRDEKMKSLSFFHSYECNLLSEDIILSKTEKQSIAELYLKTDASKINEFCDMFDCFPLLCQLYSKNTKLRMVEFFKNPFTVYKEEIDKLQMQEAYGKYCALALCVMFNICLREEWLTENVDKDIKTVIKNTQEACKVMKGTSRLVLRDELNSLTDTFIRKDGKVYRTVHDKLFDLLAFYFGSISDMLYSLIKNASCHFIRERFDFENKGDKDEFLITVPERYQNVYMNRMIDDWSRGYVQEVFCNNNMDNQIFRQRIFAHIKALEISQQKQLANIYDSKNNSTTLIQCCYIGDIDLVTWCLLYCISDVNHCCNGDKVSPTYMACQEGHTEIIQMLINNKADINECNAEEVSPLYIASEKGHTEVVQMLITNMTDINKCTKNGSSPLYIACEKGHIEVVQVLINSKADINKCRDTGASPLFIACQVGHIEIIKMLINNKADINKCRYKGSSPLLIACQEGHIEIVKMLIHTKANINKFTDTGKSPLFIGCQKGHTEIVQMLLNNKADINKCQYNEVSPLYIACQQGYTDVVRELINNKANNNKCRDTGATPLSIALEKGHNEVIQILINNKADIDMCKEHGTSHLHIVCQKRHAEK